MDEKCNFESLNQRVCCVLCVHMCIVMFVYEKANGLDGIGLDSRWVTTNLAFKETDVSVALENCVNCVHILLMWTSVWVLGHTSDRPTINVTWSYNQLICPQWPLHERENGWIHNSSPTFHSQFSNVAVKTQNCLIAVRLHPWWIPFDVHKWTCTQVPCTYTRLYVELACEDECVELAKHTLMFHMKENEKDFFFFGRSMLLLQGML